MKNITTEPTRRIETSLELTYETSPEQMADAINLAEESVNVVDGVDPEKTGAWFWEYGDWGLRTKILYHIENLEEWRDIVHSVNRNIQEAFENAGLEMAHPTEALQPEESDT